MSDKDKFIIKIKTSNGESLDNVINEVIESDLIYIDDLLSLENIINHNNIKSVNTLYLFSKYSIKDYYMNKDKYLELSNNAIDKLRIISLIDIASLNKSITFDILIKELYLDSYKYKENIHPEYKLNLLMFNALSKEYIKGKIDNYNKLLTIIEVKPRNSVNNLTVSKVKINNLITQIENCLNHLEKNKFDITENINIFSKECLEKENYLSKFKIPNFQK